jgi:serine kinase of HPr protein (carbohydrate metabolism regulator)
MNTYQIMSDNWSVSIMVKDCIQPDKVEALAKEHFTHILKIKGRVTIANEKFVSFFNQKLGEESASYANDLSSNDNPIFL